MCPMATRIAGFWSHAFIWIARKPLEPAFHRAFIWHLIREEDLCQVSDLSSPIICQMKTPMKKGPACLQDKLTSAYGKVLGWSVKESFCLMSVSFRNLASKVCTISFERLEASP